MPFDFFALSVPFRMQPGLRKLAPGAHQLTPSEIGDRYLIEKLRVLLAASAHLMRLVTSADRWERFVWTITPSALLDQHPGRHGRVPLPVGDDATSLAAASFFRTERQTFIPLPQRQQAVFTILIETTPLTRAASSAGAARQLHDAIASMTPAVLAYRGLNKVRIPLLDWLAERATTA